MGLWRIVILVIIFGCSKSDMQPVQVDDAPQDVEQKSEDAADCFNIVNGAETSAMANVTLLARSLGGNQYHFCTGTFIGSNAVLTASHCLDNSATGGMRVIDGSVVSLTGFTDVFNAAKASTKAVHHGNAYVNPSFNANDDAHRQRDVAVLIFDEDLTSDPIPVATAVPADGATVSLYGFGQISLSTALTDLRRRTGTNTLTSSNLTELLVLAGPLETQAGANTMAVFGDSGGPLIHNGQVIGVFSSIIPANEWNLYVDVRTALVTNILQSAGDQGAKIPGYFDFPDEPPPADDPPPDDNTASDDGEDPVTDPGFEGGDDGSTDSEDDPEADDADPDSEDVDDSLLIGDETSKKKTCT